MLQVPKQPNTKTMMSYTVPLEGSPWRSRRKQVNVPKRGWDTLRSTCWNRLLSGAVTLGRKEPIPE